MASLITTLPAEVLIPIAEYLETQTNRLNLAVCSRLLYRHIHHVSLQDVTFRCDKPTVTVPRLHAFLKLILTQPEMAAGVQSLALWKIPYESMYYFDDIVDDGFDIFDDTFDEPFRPLKKQFRLCPEVLELAKLIAPHTPANKEAWNIDLAKGRIAPLAALILVSLPKLQSLEFSKPYDKGYFVMVVNLACSGKAPFDRQPASSALQQLKHVSILKYESQVNGRQLLPFLRLPHMQVLTAEEVGDDLIYEHDVAEKARSLHDNPSPITRFEIARGLDWRVTCYLVSPCKNLKMFKYAHYPHARGSRGRTSDMQFFSKLLDSLKPTLEHLHLDLPPLSLCRAGGDLFTRSYTTHTKLRSLAIAAPDLLGIEIAQSPTTIKMPLISSLPEQLETLHLLGLEKIIFDTVIEQIALLLRYMDGGHRFPRLRGLYIEEFTYDFDYRPGFNPVGAVLMRTHTAYQAVMAMSEKAGVDFRLVRTVF